MTSEVEERLRFVTADYGWHRSQWVNLTYLFTYLNCLVISSLVETNVKSDVYLLLSGGIASYQI